METHFNIFDWVVLGIMALSCLFAFFRGLAREVLSLAAWVGAGLVTIYYFHDVAAKLQMHFKSPMVANIISVVGLYIAALIVFGLINTIIIKTIKGGGEGGTLDNLLGLLFGAFRGALIISLGYALIIYVLAGKEQPEWLQQAVTKPYAARGAAILASVAPEYMEDIAKLEKKASDSANADKPDIDTDTTSEDTRGYDASTSRQLNKLIDNANGQ